MRQDYPTRIGTLIRDARRHQGLSQSGLAESLGTSQSAIARIEQGKQLQAEVLLALLDARYGALTGTQRLRKTALGQALVASGIPDQGADPGGIVLTHSCNSNSPMRCRSVGCRQARRVDPHGWGVVQRSTPFFRQGIVGARQVALARGWRNSAGGERYYLRVTSLAASAFGSAFRLAGRLMASS